MPIVRILMLFLGTANHLCVNLLITGLNTTDTSKRGAIMGLNSAVTYLAVFIGNTLFGALGLYNRVIHGGRFRGDFHPVKHAIRCPTTTPNIRMDVGKYLNSMPIRCASKRTAKIHA
ncbi:hypothetical protein ABRP91_18200 [Pectobacterium brasiliense]|uniref:hypothetical protein n=1 Tax=Pectobacterium brasiliense TaxID=180957 RepID=UPI0032EE24E5